MHRTMACCPTLVVYSSSVARSFLKHRGKTGNGHQLKALQKHNPSRCQLPFSALPLRRAGEKRSPSCSAWPRIGFIPPLRRPAVLPAATQQLKCQLFSSLSFFHGCKKRNHQSSEAGAARVCMPALSQQHKTCVLLKHLNDSSQEACRQRLFYTQITTVQFSSTKVLLQPDL